MITNSLYYVVAAAAAEKTQNIDYPHLIDNPKIVSFSLTKKNVWKFFDTLLIQTTKLIEFFFKEKKR